MEFSEEEIKEKLKQLGYVNIPNHKLKEFIKDLQMLVEQETSLSIYDSSSDSTSSEYLKIPLNDQLLRSRPRAFSKEKITHKMQFSEEKENFSYGSFLEQSNSSMAQSTSSDNHSSCASIVKRKVSRKKSDGVRVFDETLTDTESQISDITHIENQIRQMPTASKTNSISSVSNNALPAFIKSSKSYLQTRCYQKCDPVNRYHQFKEEWEYNKVPGENNHSSVRWRVREQMLKVDDIEKPRHIHTTNKYVVPTDKKRQALRWQIRSAMAQIQ